MYLLVSVAANAVCLAVLLGTEQLEIKEGLWLFVVVQLCSVAQTLASMRMDIARPYFNLSGEGEVVNNNASTTMSVAMGFAVALSIGIVCMFLSYLGSMATPISFLIGTFELVLDMNFMYIVVSALTGIFFLTAVLTYTIGLKKAYNKIAK